MQAWLRTCGPRHWATGAVLSQLPPDLRPQGDYFQALFTGLFCPEDQPGALSATDEMRKRLSKEKFLLIQSDDKDKGQKVCFWFESDIQKWLQQLSGPGRKRDISPGAFREFHAVPVRDLTRPAEMEF